MRKWAKDHESMIKTGKRRATNSQRYSSSKQSDANNFNESIPCVNINDTVMVNTEKKKQAEEEKKGESNDAQKSDQSEEEEPTAKEHAFVSNALGLKPAVSSPASPSGSIQGSTRAQTDQAPQSPHPNVQNSVTSMNINQS